MKRSTPLRWLASWCALLLALPLLAAAGQSCEESALPAAEVDRALQLAWKARESLAATGAEVALIARVGQDLSKYGLRFSHMAFAWRDHPAGRWSVVHMLNTCGTATSDLYEEGLGNFFGIGVVAHVGGILVPSPALQRRLAARIEATRHWDVFSPRYNMVAFPFSTKYQNSNQWALEFLALAIDGGATVKDRASAQAWLKARGYQPTTVELGTLDRLAGRIFRANVAFDDHPLGRRLAGHIDVVSVESVYHFLMRIDPEARMSSVTLP